MNNIALSVYCAVWSRGSSISAKIDRRVSIGCSLVQENTPESLSYPRARPLLLMCDSPASEGVPFGRRSPLKRGPFPTPNHTDRLIEAAHRLRPTIKKFSADIDRERQLPKLLVRALHDAGLFLLWLPREFGGPEMSLADSARVIEA